MLELANGSNTPEWLSDLIVRTVEKDGELDDADIAIAAEQLKAKGGRELTIDRLKLDVDETVVSEVIVSVVW